MTTQTLVSVDKVTGQWLLSILHSHTPLVFGNTSNVFLETLKEFSGNTNVVLSNTNKKNFETLKSSLGTLPWSFGQHGQYIFGNSKMLLRNKIKGLFGNSIKLLGTVSKIFVILKSS